ncbi:sel1 repeat family protein [Acidiphilium sp. PA]|uniref:tetratricopeptide repeat protein n=1 Tax=Acidiphilium sp. PA TaxID=2871705 RepID=UPI0022437B62|nr:tetratricopeptide repeat protein [Acidiphilium sp. PA]MCW8308823.1 sel1 repeat family protein [Acidiphilium sp. PA]
MDVMMKPLAFGGAAVGIVVLAAIGAGWASADNGSLPTTDLKREAASGQAGAAYTLGMRYYDVDGHKPDYKKAAHWLTVAAKAGDARAQAQLAYLYQEGYGVSRDYAFARHWAGQAAAQGDGSAMDLLGDLYLHGLGVKRDYVTARSWFEKSAAKGNSAGQANLGWIYFYGLGVPKDCKRAVGDYRDSIRQSDPSGENNLAVAYFFGCGVPQNNTASLKWALIADRSITAKPGLLTEGNKARIARNIVNLEQRMTASEIATAKDEAAKWKPGD